jgi:hypothetical protein
MLPLLLEQSLNILFKCLMNYAPLVMEQHYVSYMEKRDIHHGRQLVLSLPGAEVEAGENDGDDDGAGDHHRLLHLGAAAAADSLTLIN